MDCDTARFDTTVDAAAHVAACPACQDALRWSQRGAAGAMVGSVAGAAFGAAPVPRLATFRARERRRRAGAVAALALLLGVGAVSIFSGSRPPVDLDAGLMDVQDESDGIALVAEDPLRRPMLDGGFVVDPLADLEDPTDLF